MAVRVRNKKLFIDFYCYLPDGRKVRCREATGFSENQKNRKVAQSKDKAVTYHLKSGTFCYLEFFPDGAKAQFFRRPEKDMLFSNLWEEWLSEKTLRSNTAKGWNSSYRVHIATYFGSFSLSQMNEHEIMVFRKTLEGKGLKASSINDKVMKPLCMALHCAYRRGYIKTYPCQEIARLKEEAVDIDPFSFEELRRLLDILKTKATEYHDMMLIWSRTGLRPGELFALKWRHIDYFNHKAMIRETMLPSGAEGPPKTEHSIRDVDLRPAVIDALKRQEARTALMDGYVFLTSAHKPWTDAFMRKKFRHLLKLAGLKYRPPKQMRHTFATLHIASGENISWVSRMLGYADVQITLRRYTRYVPNLTREDGSAFERVFNADLGTSKAQEHLTVG